MSHVHYAELHPMVEKKAAELGYELRSYPTIWAAIKGHYRHMKALSVPAAPARTITVDETNEIECTADAEELRVS